MSFSEIFSGWFQQEPTIHGVALIGSRARAPEDQIWQADAQSDWDFHIICSDPELFVTPEWAKRIGLSVHAYALRQAALGGVPKITAVLGETEVDIVLIPLNRIEPLRDAVARGEHLVSPELARTLQDLAIVARPGWRFLKGAEAWEPLYAQVVAEIADQRLNDPEVCNLAETFVCDWVWTRRKIERGEWIAAQRMIHRNLVETNLRLLHELKLRRGERTFPEGRRLERVGSEAERAALTMAVLPEGPSLLAGAEKCAETLRWLVGALVADGWSWPTLTGR